MANEQEYGRKIAGYTEYVWYGDDITDTVDFYVNDEGEFIKRTIDESNGYETIKPVELQDMVADVLKAYSRSKMTARSFCYTMTYGDESLAELYLSDIDANGFRGKDPVRVKYYDLHNGHYLECSMNHSNASFKQVGYIDVVNNMLQAMDFAEHEAERYRSENFDGPYDTKDMFKINGRHFNLCEINKSLNLDKVAEYQCRSEFSILNATVDIYRDADTGLYVRRYSDNMHKNVILVDYDKIVEEMNSVRNDKNNQYVITMDIDDTNRIDEPLVENIKSIDYDKQNETLKKQVDANSVDKSVNKSSRKVPDNFAEISNAYDQLHNPDDDPQVGK